VKHIIAQDFGQKQAKESPGLRRKNLKDKAAITVLGVVSVGVS
jgi:hypothetical protein